tara:strand:- start:273 stop:413 length:141 start_codon:yes stop_codon:yes gene_type:complete
MHDSLSFTIHDILCLQNTNLKNIAAMSATTQDPPRTLLASPPWEAK